MPMITVKLQLNNNFLWLDIIKCLLFFYDFILVYFSEELIFAMSQKNYWLHDT